MSLIRLTSVLPKDRRVLLLAISVLPLFAYVNFRNGNSQFLSVPGEKTAESDVMNSNTRRAMELIQRRLEREKQLMEDLAIKEGLPFSWNNKSPIRILLVTSWRSGSTFLGRVLSNHTATFNWYEPLMPFVHQITEARNAEEAVSEIKNLLHCRVTNRYVDSVRRSTYEMLSHNQGVWDACQWVDRNLSICRSKSFLAESCSKFPIQVMKLVRFRVSLTERLLDDPSLAGLKVIHLVRDPRAVMNSRWKLKWCLQNPDCQDPKIVCDLLNSDMEAFHRLWPKYRDRMMQITYEDMARDPVNVIKDVFRFAGLQFTQRIEDIIKERTSRDDPDKPWATQKKAAEKIDLWKTQLSRDKIIYVERNCLKYLSSLGYPLIPSESTDSE